MYGLTPEDLKYMNNSFSKYESIEKVILFGSRALDSYKSGSDVDIAILGKDFNRRDLFILSDELNEILPLPYIFDLINYNTIKNINLKKHIDDFGKVIYSI